jgi:transcriptional regulator with XRE-family HTH domain
LIPVGTIPDPALMRKRGEEEVPPEAVAKVSANLVRLRQEAGLDRAALEQRAELDEGAVSRLEEGEELPGAEDLMRLGGALGVDPGVFYEGIRWTPPGHGGVGYEVDPPDEPDQQSPL